MDAPVFIRPARREDCPAILDIYNEAVLNTTASYDEKPRSLAHREEWFDTHTRDGYPMFVAEASGPGIVGWSALNRFHERPGYRFTSENSIYIAPDWRGRGVGGKLLTPLIEAAGRMNLHVMIACVDASNEASVRLHRRHGFVEVSHFREVGRKFGRWLDVVHLQLTLTCDPERLA